MSETMIRWLVGLGVALVLGAFLTEWFVSALRSHMKIPKSAGRVMPSWLMGLSERLFFTLIVAFNISGAAIAMIGWMMLKVLPNWELYVTRGSANKPLAMSSLLGSLCSMFFALIGGLICSGRIWIGW